MDYTTDKTLQKEVAALLNWDMQQYSQFIEDCGIAYLEKYIPNYPQVVKQITRSKIFWNWWKAAWEKRDQQFVETIDLATDSIIDPVEIYTELHDPRSLAEAVYLNGQVLQESYAEMIGQITKLQTRKEVAA